MTAIGGVGRPLPAGIPIELDRGDIVLRGTAHGIESGAGPTLVLLHAGGEDRRVWEPVIGEVRRLLPVVCIAVDQRGHGATPGRRDDLWPLVDDLAALLGSIEGPTILVGCSLGGLAAVGSLADPAAGAVVGLVLVDVVPAMQPEAVWRFLEAWGLLPASALLARTVLTGRSRLESALVRFPGPVALVRAAASALTDGDVDRFLARRPDASISIVADAGHLVARDRPVELGRLLVATITDWLDRPRP